MHRIRFLTFLAAAVFFLTACGPLPNSGEDTPAGGDFTYVPDTTRAADLSALGYRSIWFSYFEWQTTDCSSKEAFRDAVRTVCRNTASLGLNWITVQVRPFGDAVYPSSIFPWSHVVTGTQGAAPSFDPLAVFIEEAHAAGLSFEAWINPYRVRLTESLPSQLADSNPAVTHPDWVREANGGLYYDPAIPEVQQMIVEGVREVVANYDVDGVQFDDYFYPTTDASFDAETYAVYGGGQALDAWRRENVNTLVKTVYETVKAEKPDVRFGISPQGNNDNNYNGQYSDVALWMSEPGYVDYVLPQVYWGYGYTLQSGSQRFAFENITAEWAAMERCDAVELYFGLGAYRIGDGDGGANDQTQWSSGHNLADQVNTLSETAGASGVSVYPYRYLFANGEHPELAAAECEALRGLLAS